MLGSGIFDKMNWNCTELYQDLLRLRGHVGTPHDDDLTCPIFTQDKVHIIIFIDCNHSNLIYLMIQFNYIQPLGDFCIPTMKIPLCKDGYLSKGMKYTILDKANT